MNQFNFNLSEELSTHDEWDDILKHSNPRERSYSRLSIGSSIQSKSYQINLRTTPATKAVAAKRRKEGNEARYVCEMCGEGFTRRVYEKVIREHIQEKNRLCVGFQDSSLAIHCFAIATYAAVTHCYGALRRVGIRLPKVTVTAVLIGEGVASSTLTGSASLAYVKGSKRTNFR
ncbi:hypothetical protein DFH28DRAFT_1196890, partial [Melampsora americana]